MTIRAILASAFAFAVAAAPTAAADLPVFDAHIHYSHDAWENLPPKAAIDVLRKAGIRRALVSSSGDEGTQRRRQHETPVETHVPDEAGNGAAGAGESRQLARAEQRGVRRIREGRKQCRQLDQSAAAGQRVDESRAERSDEDEEDFQGHDVSACARRDGA